MKKYIFLLIFLFTAIFVFGQQPPPITSQRYVTAQSGLRLRDSPSFNGTTLTIIPFDEMVILFGEYSNEITVDNLRGRWAKIFYENFTGWVFDGYLSTRNSFGRRTNLTQGVLFENIKKEFMLEDFPTNPKQIISAKIEIDSNNKIIKYIFTDNENPPNVIRETIRKEPIRTTRGIGIGDPMDRIIEIYPGAQYNEQVFSLTWQSEPSFSWAISYLISSYYVNRIVIIFNYDHENRINRIIIEYQIYEYPSSEENLIE